MIQAKRYEEARALLLTVDHPTADKWLERLKEYIPATPAPSITPLSSAPVTYSSELPAQSFTGKLVLTIVLLFCLVAPGIIALIVFSREAKEAQARSNQVIPGANELIFLNKFLFVIILIGVLLLLVFALLPLINYYL